MIRIGVKYCGNCNPQINSPEIIRALGNLLPEEYRFIPWAQGDYRVLIVMGGCPADCADRPEFSGPLISVAGKHVDLQAVEEKDIPEVLLSKIIQYFK